MSTHTDVVIYSWTELDRLATLTKFPGQYVTPYRIKPDAIPNADRYVDGDRIEISLAKSVDPATIARFFRDPYEWIPLPEGVDPGATMKDLFDALYAFDKVKFAHMDFKSAAIGMGVGAVKNLLSSKPKVPGFDDISPLADLASLHFEYWGNTDLRGATFRGTMSDASLSVLGISGLTIPWFGSDPLSMPIALLEPLAAPTVKDDVTIQYVLAKRPARGVMVQAPPSRKETDLPIVVMSLTPPTLELDGWNRQVIAPFDLGDSVKSGDNALNFKVTLPRPSVKTRFEILKGGEVYYAESHEGGEWLLPSPAPHSWSWNGYSNDGVYDTAALWGNDLVAKITTVDPLGRVTSATCALGSGRDKIRWIDVKVDRKAKTCTVAVWAQILNPSQVDIASLSLHLPDLLGGLLPGLPGVPTLPSAPALPSIPGFTGGDLKLGMTIPKAFDLDKATFDDFKKYYVIESIARHWSRCKTPAMAEEGPHAPELGDRDMGARWITIDGEQWDLHVACNERPSDSFDMILAKNAEAAFDEMGLPDPLSGIPGSPGERSTNLAYLMEGLPIIDVDDAAATPDVGAHELGHSVLREASGVWFSLTHKGTSTPFQNKIEGSHHPGYQAFIDDALSALGSRSPQYQSNENYQKVGPDEDLDVMLYYYGHKTDEILARMFAVEEDALALVWMGKTAFG